jgi:hypothetical protein
MVTSDSQLIHLLANVVSPPSARVDAGQEQCGLRRIRATPLSGVLRQRKRKMIRADGRGRTLRRCQMSPVAAAQSSYRLARGATAEPVAAAGVSPCAEPSMEPQAVRPTVASTVRPANSIRSRTGSTPCRPPRHRCRRRRDHGPAGRTSFPVAAATSGRVSGLQGEAHTLVTAYFARENALPN